MKKTFAILLLIVCHFVQSQQTISGTFSPAEDYSWLIAYRLKPGSQAYVADTSIKEGQFKLNMPSDALAGTYRLVYAIPQDQFYIDVIWSGKEDVKFDFRADSGPIFTTSSENILFSMYFAEISEAESELIESYTSGGTEENEFSKLTGNLDKIQKSYENKSEGLLVEHFIKANRPYIPSKYQDPENYIQSKKKNYFTHLNFKDSILQGSEFLTTKLSNFVFTALPLKELSDIETENAIRENIKTSATKIQDLAKNHQFHLYHSLWEYASALELNSIADFILKDFLKSKATSEENKAKLNQIEINNRLSIGQIPPEIEWRSKGALKRLSALGGASNYILIFWSSTCSHCLNELPALHKELKKRENIKVVAIGLEDEELNWKVESEKLDSFEHVLALGKWESTYAKLYDIHGTPTYFVLDSEKRIIAKPHSDKEVVAILED